MLKKVLTLSAASVALSVPAYAGFYLNPEFNQTNVGSEWGGNAIDLHIGYENTVGENGSFYLQGGLVSLMVQEILTLSFLVKLVVDMI